MQGRDVFAWIVFHGLDFSAIMVIAGCAIAIHRRLTDRGAIASQTFLLDFTPHLMLIAISVSGLMLTTRRRNLGNRQEGKSRWTHHLTNQKMLWLVPSRVKIKRLFPAEQYPAGKRPMERGRTAVWQARLVLFVMINVAQLWILSATVEAALARQYKQLLPLVISSGVCWVIALTIFLWWKPASRRHTSTGYLRGK